ncbi:SDR family NAD(P)-dependent oxidoreductase [Amycolatopsis sp. NPDC101161]|uniref:SDR family NAD(P)-dependent oxidoreductase n=1 Tax=Amycolatopsis sp. NPDC101161 TaxID=3363940 RepID=UPI0037FF1CC6
MLGDLRAVRAALDVNFWGTLSMARAFAPVLAANGGGAIVNIASSASLSKDPREFGKQLERLSTDQ